MYAEFLRGSMWDHDDDVILMKTFVFQTKVH